MVAHNSSAQHVVRINLETLDIEDNYRVMRNRILRELVPVENTLTNNKPTYIFNIASPSTVHSPSTKNTKDVMPAEM